MVAAIEGAVPSLMTAQDFVERFHHMLQSGTPEALSAWITEAKASLITSFDGGIAELEVAVRSALNEAWSNGITEGGITRLKRVRRQMYGRDKLDLLPGAAGRAASISIGSMKAAPEPFLDAD